MKHIFSAVLMVVVVLVLSVPAFAQGLPPTSGGAGGYVPSGFTWGG